MLAASAETVPESSDTKTLPHRSVATAGSVAFAFETFVFSAPFFVAEHGAKRGTPSGVGPLSAGDEIEIEIDGIGRLKNVVA
jgi:protein involved in polysaccharide export with SLBB domain